VSESGPSVAMIDHGGVRLAYEVAGCGAATPLVLIHGLGDSRRLWDRLARDLASDRRIVSYDLRGHGESDVPPDPSAYSMPIFVADLRALLDELALDRALLVGFSLGGAVALHFALAHPDRVAGLAVLNANAAARDPAEEAAMERAQAGGEAGAALMKEQERRWATRLLERLPAGARLASSVGRGASIVDRAAQLSMPVWLIASDRDPGFVERSAALLSRLPAGERVVIEGAGHAIMIDQPGALGGVLRRFVAANG